MNVSLHCILVLSLSAVFIEAAMPAQAAEFLMIVDSSGSMQEVTSDGERKMDAAKRALGDLKSDLSPHQVGVMVFGHRTDPKTTGCCEDVQVLMPISEFKESVYDAVIGSVAPRGATPLAESFRQAGIHLAQHDKDANKIIVVVTDGNETCGGDPVAEVTALRAQGMNVTIHVIGFGVKPNEVAQLERLAQAGGGRFGLAETKTQLADELRKVVQPPVDVVTIKLSPLETALVARFKDEDQTVRRTAADTLLKMKATATLPLLHQRVLQEEEYYAWRSAVLALIGLDDERATAALVEAMTADNHIQRQWAAEWVPETSDRSEPTKLTSTDQTLVRLLTDAKPEIRLAAAKSLQRRTAVAASGDLYARIQVESEYYAWREALTALKSLAPDQAVDAIVAALEVDDKNIRGWAADWAAEVSK